VWEKIWSQQPADLANANDIGYTLLPSQEDCLYFCNLFTQLQLKADGLEKLPAALEGCLVQDQW
jgi:hypothetical protein